MGQILSDLLGSSNDNQNIRRSHQPYNENSRNSYSNASSDPVYIAGQRHTFVEEEKRRVSKIPDVQVKPASREDIRKSIQEAFQMFVLEEARKKSAEERLRTLKAYEAEARKRELLKKERRIKHYCNSHKILLVGEGDFSFSACLAKAFVSANNMVATSRDSIEPFEGSEEEEEDPLTNSRQQLVKLFLPAIIILYDAEWIADVVFDTISSDLDSTFPKGNGFNCTADAFYNANSLLIVVPDTLPKEEKDHREKSITSTDDVEEVKPVIKISNVVDSSLPRKDRGQLKKRNLSKRERWIMHYCSSHSILIFGEGDFSFLHVCPRLFFSQGR